MNVAVRNFHNSLEAAHLKQLDAEDAEKAAFDAFIEKSTDRLLAGLNVAGFSWGDVVTYMASEYLEGQLLDGLSLFAANAHRNTLDENQQRLTWYNNAIGTVMDQFVDRHIDAFRAAFQAHNKQEMEDAQ